MYFFVVKESFSFYLFILYMASFQCGIDLLEAFKCSAKKLKKYIYGYHVLIFGELSLENYEIT